MADTATFFTPISCFFSALWACLLRLLSLKPGSTIHPDDLEVGIPSEPVNRQATNHFSTASPVVSSSRPIDGFVDIGLGPDGKIKEAKAVSVDAHIVPVKASVIDNHSRHFQLPAVKNDRTVSVSFPPIPMLSQIHAVDNRNKHRAIQFGPYAVHTLPEDRPRSKRRHPSSFSDLLDQFPAPPTHIPPLPPVINGDVVLQTIKKAPLAPAENCPSPTISEASTVSSSSGSNSMFSTHPSISISNETANTSVHEMLQSVPRTSSAISRVLSSGIDVKTKNIARLTLVHNPDAVIFPAMSVRGRPRSQSLVTFQLEAYPQTYYDVVDSPRQAYLQKGDISKDTFSKEREKVDTPAFILEDHISRGKRYEAELESLEVEYSLAPIHNLENSSQRLPVDRHTSIRTPVQAVPAAPAKSIRPVVAPLRIVKKNKVQPVVIPLEPPSALKNWEQAVEDVLQAFRDAQMENGEFCDLFYGNTPFVSQSSIASGLWGSDRGDLDGRDEYDGDCEKQLEDSFDGIHKSVDENLSMHRAPPDLVALKVEDLASAPLSSERADAQRTVELKHQINNAGLPVLRSFTCERYEDSYSWTAATDDDEEDNHSQGDGQAWSERLELHGYVS